MRKKIIGAILGALLGYIMASVGLYFTSWQYWAICLIIFCYVLNALYE